MEPIRFRTADGTPIVDIDPSEVDRIASITAIPGEIVHLRNGDKPFTDEIDSQARFEARQALAGRDLKVESTVVVIDIDRRTTKTLHTFEGVPGDYAGTAFVDPRPMEYLYGVLVTIDEDLWLVPLDGNAGDQAVAVPDKPAFRVLGIERCARHQLMDSYHYGRPDDGGVADLAALKESMREPAAGELHVVVEPNGDRKLFAAPWTSGCSESEIRVAHEAISQIVNAAAPRV